MKSSNSFVLILLIVLFGFIRANGSEEFFLTLDESKNQKILSDWTEIYSQYKLWLFATTMNSRAKSEKQFISEFLDRSDQERTKFLAPYTYTKHYNNDNLAIHFAENARLGLTNCGVDNKLTDEERKELDSKFKAVSIIIVPFRLCALVNESHCSFDAALAAKNYPHWNLILVSYLKYVSMEPFEKVRNSTHEFLGLLKKEINTYQLSSSLGTRISVTKDHDSNTTYTNLCETN